MDLSELSRFTRFAAKGGIGKCTAVNNCVAKTSEDLMFIEGEEIIVLMQLPDNEDTFLGFCEGIVGRFKAQDVRFHGQLKKPVITKRLSVSGKTRSLTPDDGGLLNNGNVSDREAGTGLLYLSSLGLGDSDNNNNSLHDDGSVLEGFLYDDGLESRTNMPVSPAKGLVSLRPTQQPRVLNTSALELNHQKLPEGPLIPIRGDTEKGWELVRGSETQDQLLIIKNLLKTLQNADKRQKLLVAGDTHVQTIVDFLNSALSEMDLDLLGPSRKHMIVALYQLCRDTERYPCCYLITNILLPSDRRTGGGFSDVYLGTHSQTRQILCVKVMRTFEAAEKSAMLKAYAKEAMMWGQLRHPSIAPFYGVFYMGSDPGTQKICLVSPWMANGDLTQYLSKNHIAPRESLIYDISLGLEYLHSELSVVHGDLKGANILVNDAGYACITDFGMSVVHSESSFSRKVATSTARGFSTRWAAPELIPEGDDEDVVVHPTYASDVWAFGCVCHEILTGKLPFPECKHDFHVMRKLIEKATPGKVGGAKIWELVSSCWSIDPEYRPTSTDILEFLATIPGVPRGFDEDTQSQMEQERKLFSQAVRDSAGTQQIDFDQVESILRSICR